MQAAFATNLTIEIVEASSHPPDCAYASRGDTNCTLHHLAPRTSSHHSHHHHPLTAPLPTLFADTQARASAAS